MDAPETRPSMRAAFVAAGACVVAAIALDAALGTPSSNPDAVTFVGRLHPLVVHLPIGAIVLLGTLELASLIPQVRGRIDPALSTLLSLALGASLAAFAVGLMLAHGGGYPPGLLQLHRLFALAIVVGAAVSLAAWAAHIARRAPRWAYQLAIVATVLLLSVGAHFGGSMTHGETWLTRYAPSWVRERLEPRVERPAPSVATPGAGPSQPLVFRDAVLPVLVARCGECHGPDQQKAGLRLDSLEALRKGGDSGPVIEAGHAATSLAVIAIRKPLDDDAHMPPANQAQLGPGELNLLELWIERGASAELAVRDILVPDEAHALLRDVAARGPALAIAPPPGATSATPPAGPSAAPKTDDTAPPDVANTESPSPSTPTPTPTPVDATPNATTTDFQGTASQPGTAFDGLVVPLLASKCGRCHGAAKQKGKLRTDSLAALLAGGRNGPAVVSGDPSRGTLLARVALPLAVEEHMPPRAEPQLEAREIELLSFWIRQGATTSLAVRELPASLRAAVPSDERTVPPGGAPSDTPPPAASSAASAAAEPAPTPAVAPGVPSSPPARTPARPVRLFVQVVAPMLEEHCAPCHSGAAPMADFDATKRDDLFVGTRIVPGEPERSTLMGQLIAPLEDGDHMPPKGQSQPSAGQIDAFRLWIARDATEDLIVDESELAPGLLAQLAASKAPDPAARAGDGAGPENGAATPDAVRAGGCAACTVEARATNAHAPGLLFFATAILVLRRLLRR